MISDLRYALRQWRKSPGFTLTALFTLALCLGANLTIFAVINSILLRPLPFPNADRLVNIYNTYPKAGVENDGASITNYYERRGNIPAFESLALYMERAETIGDPGSMQQEDIVRISPEFFATLGVNPAIGRGFTEEDMAYQQNVIILTDAFWRQQFDSDPNILGRDTRINGIERKIVGVLPPAFRFLSSEARVFLPIKTDIDQRGAKARHSGGGGTHLIARLKPGATIGEAQAQVDAHNDAVEKDNPEAKAMAEAGFRSLVRQLHAEHVRSIRPTLLLMQSGVFFLLLIGAVNLINLLLIRASSRAKEMAIRQSMGASRQHVVRQVVVETVLLTAIGGLLGVLAGAWGTQLLQLLGANRLPLGAHIVFDGWLAVIGLVSAVILGLVIAVPIAWFNLHSHLANALQSESRAGTINRATQRLRHGFIIAQIALAFVLLAGAALLGLSLKKVMAVPSGFRADHVLTGECTISWQLLPDRIAIADRLLESIRQQPGIAAAGTITNIPLSGDSGKAAFAPKGYVPPPGQSLRGHYSYGVSGDYFSALGIPLREGRFLNSADSHRAERVCVVDEDFSRRYWPNGGALGNRIFEGNDTDDAKLFTIVGVVGNVKQAELTEAQGQGAVYVPYAYRDPTSVFVVTRTSQRPEAFAETLRKLVHAAHPEIAFDNIRSMDTRVTDSLIARRSPALLAGIFAGVALLLAAIGTYGVLSYAVAQRRREIGIRMAVGAQRKQIGQHFLSLGLRLLAAGTFFGLIGAWFAGRAMRSILFGVPALPVAALVGTALVMSAVSLIACLIPACRASLLDPIEALRSE
ncbi:MAG: ABC transporter permease [Verrucomicrobiota bacterium]|nr:ABC transporter permease [Verrucomicrobiota bacterium]MDQ6938522.1 ABC transporter permease [Verrucomicrobiota bacterium]